MRKPSGESWPSGLYYRFFFSPPPQTLPVQSRIYSPSYLQSAEADFACVAANLFAGLVIFLQSAEADFACVVIFLQSAEADFACVVANLFAGNIHHGANLFTEDIRRDSSKLAQDISAM